MSGLAPRPPRCCLKSGNLPLGYYLGRESTASTYGSAGAVVVLLLLWVYYASCILLFGAEFTQVYARATGQAIIPAPGAEPVTAKARAEQGMEPEKVSPADDARLVACNSPPRLSPPVVAVALEPARAGRFVPILSAVGAAFLLGVLARVRLEKEG